MNLIIDSIMGSGKTTWAINYMNRCPQRKFIFATPFLKEDARIEEACPGLHFVEPTGIFSKLSDLKKLIAEGKNIATTHALLDHWIPSAADIDHLAKWNYTLILDETIEVIQPVRELNANDLQLLCNEEIEIDEESGKIRWISQTAPQRYQDIKKLAQNGRLFLCHNSQLLNLLPITLFNAMPHIIIMTFLFEASHLYHYLRIHKIPWRKAYIQNGRLFFGEEDLSQKKREIKMLLTLYQGKYNECGEPRESLSATFWSKRSNLAKRRQILNNIRSYFLTFCRAHIHQCAWSIFKDKNGSDINCVKGFKNAFIPFNCRATNEYATRIYLAYAVNVYENPMVYAWFEKNGSAPNQDLFALSEMIQWIWRSAIRNGQPVCLYLPSKRMRKILCDWLDS